MAFYSHNLWILPFLMCIIMQNKAESTTLEFVIYYTE